MKRIVSVFLVLIMVLSCNTFALEEKLDAKFMETGEQTVSASGYITPSARTLSRKVGTARLGSSSYPSSYDSRVNNYISAPGNQGSTELCWAFVQASTAEAYVSEYEKKV